MNTPTPITTAQAASTEITKLQKQAKDVLEEGAHTLAERIREGEGIGFQFTEHEILSELVTGTSQLATDLVDVLQKIASGNRPFAVMQSDLTRRIQDAEVRLEMLRQLSR